MGQLGEFVSNNLFLFGALIVILMLLIRTFITPSGITRLSVMEAVKKMNQDDSLMLDVRSESEFADGHILNATNIPVALLSSRINEIKEHASHPVVLVCQSGNRSIQAASTLKKQGFTELYNLEGGMMAWKNANLPVNKPASSKTTKNKKNKKDKVATDSV